MTQPLVVSQARSYPVPPDKAFVVALETPLEQIFTRRFAAMPPIREVRGQDGAWGTVGQTRTIVTSDGGRLTEELTSVDRPDSFGYGLRVISGPMKPLVSSVEGRWSFAEAGTGCTVTWAWTVHPATDLAARMMPVFGWMWRGYARAALGQLEGILLNA
ncbi:MAG: SRPBCC family protein [Nocardioidaceae bacterium]